EEKKKCGSSKKRIGLLGYKCRCARIICVKHQYSEEHGCMFYHMVFERPILEKEHPVF
ncbi:Zinc finger A20 and AN1 domain-containing stress-associated protein 8, partial [Linum perenne]